MSQGQLRGWMKLKLRAWYFSTKDLDKLVEELHSKYFIDRCEISSYLERLKQAKLRQDSSR